MKIRAVQLLSFLICFCLTFFENLGFKNLDYDRWLYLTIKNEGCLTLYVQANALYGYWLSDDLKTPEFTGDVVILPGFQQHFRLVPNLTIEHDVEAEIYVYDLYRNNTDSKLFEIYIAALSYYNKYEVREFQSIEYLSEGFDKKKIPLRMNFTLPSFKQLIVNENPNNQI